jgi:hypothetical protein
MSIFEKILQFETCKGKKDHVKIFIVQNLRENSIPSYQHAQAVIDIYIQDKIATLKMVDLCCSKIHSKIATTTVDLTEEKKYKRLEDKRQITSKSMSGVISSELALQTSVIPR